MHRTERKLAYIAAGGMIDKRYDPKEGIMTYPKGKRPAIFEILHRMAPAGHLKISSFPPMDQVDTDHENLENYSVVANECAITTAEGVVITHDIDAMVETGAHISARALDKTIVITGSSLPASDRDSDADANVAFATALALVLPHGVYTAMHGRYYLWNECEVKDGHLILRKHH